VQSCRPLRMARPYSVPSINWVRPANQLHLNLRPLGYEFNTWFWTDSVIAKNQSHTVSMCLIISTVSGSPVSNLLALLMSRPAQRPPHNGPIFGFQAALPVSQRARR
jgi:hypothetical protein